MKLKSCETYNETKYLCLHYSFFLFTYNSVSFAYKYNQFGSINTDSQLNKIHLGRQSGTNSTSA